MAVYPKSVTQVPFGQKTSFVGIAWDAPKGVNVTRYELFVSSRAITPDQIEAFCTGQLPFVKKYSIESTVLSAVDNVTSQFTRMYYSLLAVDQNGNYVDVAFNINDSKLMALTSPRFLKEPAKPAPAVPQPTPVVAQPAQAVVQPTPTVAKPVQVVPPRVTLPSLSFISYTQRPEGLRVKWRPPTEGTPIKYEVYLSQFWPSSSNIPDLLSGKLDRTRMVEVPGNVTEVIDNVTPRDSKSYYTIVARGEQGEYWGVDFNVGDAGHLKLESPRFLDPSNMAETEAIARQVLEEARKLASTAEAMPAQPLDDRIRQFDQAIFLAQTALNVIPNWGDALKFIEEVKAGKEAAEQATVKARWDEELEKAREALKWHESPDGSRWRDPEGAEKIVNFVLLRMPNYPGTLELMAEIEKIKREEKEYEDVKSAGHTAQQNGNYDEAITMFSKALKMRPEGKEAESLKGYIEDCKDMRVLEQGLKAAGSDISKIEKLYMQFDERGRHRIAMKALWEAYHKLGSYPIFSLLMGKLLEGDEDTEAVALFLEAQRKKGFLEQGGFTSAQLADIANKLDSLQGDIEDLRGQLRDIESQRNDLERELSEAIKVGLGAGGGSGESEWVSRIRGAIDRNRNAEGRVKDQIERAYGNMGRILRMIFI